MLTTKELLEYMPSRIIFELAPVVKLLRERKVHANRTTVVAKMKIRFIAVLWCGASAFSPLVAGLSISSTAGAMQFQTALQLPIPLKLVLQLMSFFLTTRTAAASMHVPGA